ncbi:MAG: mismatch repair protein, partial [Acidimicrobiaceae bacterium]|nr:mismatch repair protein [Acidimicrobiaceae bacterium]
PHIQGMEPPRFPGRIKFLKIGYSKRKAGEATSPSGRPFIGRKGIGKLALLSCANKIAIITKTSSSSYVGGIIDNNELDRAITDDLTPDEYPLEILDESRFADYVAGHDHGTIIFFENIKDGIRNSLDNLKKTIALYFRFSLIDDSFNIYVEDELVDISCLNDLIANTEFLWKLNDIDDPYIKRLEEVFDETNEVSQLSLDARVKGFIASVKKPSQLNIIGTGEQVKVDLFVNGRLRERDILRHIPTARLAESYLYGQIHFDVLDDGEDRFTSSRESVIANDPLFEQLLKIVQEDIMRVILVDWDKWRRKHNKDGDPEDSSITLKERKSGELFNAVADEYKSPVAEDGTTHKVDQWVQDLGEDARFSFTSYAECYVGENLLRQYIEDQSVALTDPANREVTEWRGRETTSKADGNINIDIRKIDNDLSYLDMATLSKVVDHTGGTNSLPNDAKQYKPLRDALMHTALLSDEAKRKLTTVFDNIKARIKALL